MEKTKCSFCGKEINCPKEELEAEKHACYDCYLKQEDKLSDEELEQIQVDVPDDQLNNALVQEVVEDFFDLVWEDRQEEIKNLSKKEAAQFMFAAGASAMAERITEMDNEEDFDDEEE